MQHSVFRFLATCRKLASVRQKSEANIPTKQEDTLTQRNDGVSVSNSISVSFSLKPSHIPALRSCDTFQDP